MTMDANALAELIAELIAEPVGELLIDIITLQYDLDKHETDPDIDPDILKKRQQSAEEYVRLRSKELLKPIEEALRKIQLDDISGRVSALGSGYDGIRSKLAQNKADKQDQDQRTRAKAQWDLELDQLVSKRKSKRASKFKAGSILRPN